MMHEAEWLSSRLLNGRTRTATFTEDMIVTSKRETVKCLKIYRSIMQTSYYS